MVFLLLLALLIALGCFAAYSISPAAKARKRAKRALQVLETLDGEITAQDRQIREAVSHSATGYVQAIRIARLCAISVEELRRHGSRLRLQALRDAGLRNLADLQGWGPDRIAQLRGVGPKSAASISYLVSTLSAQSNALPVPHPLPPSERGPERPLIEAICLNAWSVVWFADKHQKLLTTIQQFRLRRNRVAAKTSLDNWLRGFGHSPDIQSGIAEAEALAREIEGRSPTAELCSELTGILNAVRACRSNGLQWDLVVKHYAAGPDYYVRVLTEHLGASGAAGRQHTIAAVNQWLFARPHLFTRFPYTFQSRLLRLLSSKRGKYLEEVYGFCRAETLT